MTPLSEILRRLSRDPKPLAYNRKTPRNQRAVKKTSTSQDVETGRDQQGPAILRTITPPMFQMDIVSPKEPRPAWNGDQNNAAGRSVQRNRVFQKLVVFGDMLQNIEEQQKIEGPLGAFSAP